MRFLARTWCALAQRAAAVPEDDRDRGDVPGWVLVTLMTAGLVSVLWFVAGDALQRLFVDAISDVSPRSGT
ncbi:hypothetical protein [Cellulomonas dongxiuzhuiae]|uniref:DUF4244 domain-containing protein n=1 Tax=Cellulomonas dongxiuzhuiae TaxID=2819979 RepID=A0ABX8GNT6_9CELL|nr:hypothetical protein [Cellulomonas dongxiuzhuiae]MBO3087772.1 hypothetical protein [Cellulomonas dongxiuzhuiae]MBO3095860.1 hypothetical protein [Cellulomonas dongxiuzhuiae]QWC17166.1 hypothetical protein KKR89_06075 [Cellulomonas dongxiuzhuiae]